MTVLSSKIPKMSPRFLFGKREDRLAVYRQEERAQAFEKAFPKDLPLLKGLLERLPPGGPEGLKSKSLLGLSSKMEQTPEAAQGLPFRHPFEKPLMGQIPREKGQTHWTIRPLLRVQNGSEAFPRSWLRLLHDRSRATHSRNSR